MGERHFIVYEGPLDTASVGGAQFHFLGIGAALVRRGANVVLLTPGYRGSRPWPAVEGATHLQPRVGRKSLPALALYEFRKLVILLRLRRQFGAAGTLLTRLGVSSWSTGAARLLGYRVILEVNGPLEDELRHRGYSRPIRAIVGAMASIQYRAAHEIVAVTENLGRQLRERRSTNVRVIPNGSDAPIIGASDVASPHIADLADRPPGTPLLVYSGALAPWQDLGLVVEGVRRLRETGQDWRLVVIGDGERRDALLAAVKGAKLDAAVTFLGWQPHEVVVSVLGIGDIGLVPANSRGESDISGSPLKLFEYLAAGLPVVAADADGVRELDYPLVFTYAQHDADGFVRACTAAITVPRPAGEALSDLQHSVSWDQRVEQLWPAIVSGKSQRVPS